MEEAFGCPGESISDNVWLLILVSSDFKWSAAGDRQHRESSEVDDKFSVLDFFRSGSFPAS